MSTIEYFVRDGYIYERDQHNGEYVDCKLQPIDQAVADCIAVIHAAGPDGIKALAADEKIREGARRRLLRRHVAVRAAMGDHVSDAARDRLTRVLVDHQRRDIGNCLCGWGKKPEHLGLSHSAHVLDALLEHRDDLAEAAGLWTAVQHGRDLLRADRDMATRIAEAIRERRDNAPMRERCQCCYGDAESIARSFTAPTEEPPGEYIPVDDLLQQLPGESFGIPTLAAVWRRMNETGETARQALDAIRGGSDGP